MDEEILHLTVDFMHFVASSKDGKNYAILWSCDEYDGEELRIPKSIYYLGVEYKVSGIHDFFGEYNYTVKTLYITNSIIKFDSSAILTLKGLTDIIVVDVEIQDYNDFTNRDGCLYNNDMTELLMVPNAKEGVLNIPEGVKIISGLYGCYKLDKIIIPSTLENIYMGFPLSNCRYEVNERNQHFTTHGYDLLSKDEKLLYRVSPLATKGDWVIDEKHQLFGDCVFANAQITSIRIDKGIIPSGCFEFCNQLHYVIIGDNVTDIGSYPFITCKELREFYIYKKDPKLIDLHQLEGDEEIKTFSPNNTDNCTLHVLKGLKETYRQLEPWNQFVNIVDDLDYDNVVDPKDLERKYNEQQEVVYDEDDEHDYRWVWIVAILVAICIAIYYSSSRKTTNNDVSANNNISQNANVENIDTAKDTATWYWSNNDYNYTIKYNPKKISEQLINNAFNFIIRSDYTDAYNDASSFCGKLPTASEAIAFCNDEENKYNQYVQEIQNIQLPKSKDFDNLKNLRLKYIKSRRRVARYLLMYFYDISAFSRIPFNNSELIRYRDILVSSDEDLIEGWKDWFMEESKNNGDPESMINECMEEYNSSDALQYAKKDILTGALNNLLLHTYSFQEYNSPEEVFKKALGPFVTSINIECMMD
jgi:hypothetical protein